MTQVTPKLISKQQAELDKLLREKVELEARISPLWQQLRMFRLVAIRAGDDPGPLPQLLGVEPLERAGQENAERRERENYAITMSPQHQAALRDLNSAA
jgi:hypothetical protein